MSLITVARHGAAEAVATNGRADPVAPFSLDYGDGLRCLAACCVVLIHVASAAPRAPRAPLWPYYAANEFSRWCVPAFFMLSGALLLDPARDEPGPTFYRKRFRKIGVPLVVWSVFYFLFRALVLRESFTMGDVLRNVATGDPMYHLWFLFTLAGLYAATPLIRAFFVPASVKLKWSLTLACVAVSSLSLLCAILIGKRGRPGITDEWAYYLGFFLLGFLLRDKVLTRKGILIGVLVYLLASVVGTLAFYAAWKTRQPYRWSILAAAYQSPIIIVQSVAAFLVLATALSKPVFGGPAVRTLGRAAFGAYLVHVAVMDCLIQCGWEGFFGAGTAPMWALWLVVVVLSFAVSLLLLKVPIVRTTVGG